MKFVLIFKLIFIKLVHLSCMNFFDWSIWYNNSTDNSKRWETSWKIVLLLIF